MNDTFMNNANTYNPLKLTSTKQWLIAGFLFAVLLFTRAGFVPHAQDASWAVFFLVGFYLRSYLGLPALLLSAMVLDFGQIAAQGGHQDYYLAPSYLFIIPAYSTLWFAGRFFANKYSENIKGLLTFIASAVVGIIACDLISHGGFYWMSSIQVEVSMSDFISRSMDYMPISLKVNMLYLSLAAMTHLAFVQASKFSNTQKQNT